MTGRLTVCFVTCFAALGCSPPGGGNNFYQPTGAGTGSDVGDPGTAPTLPPDPPVTNVTPTDIGDAGAPPTNDSGSAVPPAPVGAFPPAMPFLLSCPARGPAKAWQVGAEDVVNVCAHTYRVRVKLPPMPALVWDSGAAAAGIDEGMGAGWRVAHEATLEVDTAAKTATLYDGEYGSTRFAQDASGTWVAEPYVYKTITQTGPTTYTIVDSDGAGMQFDLPPAGAAAGAVQIHRISIMWTPFDLIVAGTHQSRTTYGRDGAGHLTSVVTSGYGAGNHMMTYHWTGSRIDSLTWQDSRTYALHYTGNALTGVETDSAGTTTLGYDGAGNLKTVTNAMGEVLDFTVGLSPWLTITQQNPDPTNNFVKTFTSAVVGGKTQETELDQDGYGKMVEYACFTPGCGGAGAGRAVYVDQTKTLPSQVATNVRRNAAGYTYQITSEEDGTSTTWSPPGYGDGVPLPIPPPPGSPAGTPSTQQITVKNVTGSGSRKPLLYVATAWNDRRLPSRILRPTGIDELRYEYERPGGKAWDPLGLWRVASRTKANNGTVNMTVVALTVTTRSEAASTPAAADATPLTGALYKIESTAAPATEGIGVRWLDQYGRLVAEKKAGSRAYAISHYDSYGYVDQLVDQQTGQTANYQYMYGGVKTSAEVKNCNNLVMSSFHVTQQDPTTKRITEMQTRTGDVSVAGTLMTTQINTFFANGATQTEDVTASGGPTTSTTYYLNGSTQIGRDVTTNGGVNPPVTQNWRWRSRGYPNNAPAPDGTWP